MIEGVKIIPLRQIADERGKIMHMLKATDPHFIRFGEIYFSCAWPGTIKAWHIHQSMTINNAVLFAGRSKTRNVRPRDLVRRPRASFKKCSSARTTTAWCKCRRASPTATRHTATKW